MGSDAQTEQGTELEFHVHSDLWEQIPLSHEAWLVYVRCGNWTARHDADGIVPADLPMMVDYTPEQRSIDDPQMAVNELCGARLWEPLLDGRFRMLRGPANDWDAPLPLWRYSPPLAGGREIAPQFWEYPDPDE